MKHWISLLIVGGLGLALSGEAKESQPEVSDLAEKTQERNIAQMLRVLGIKATWVAEQRLSQNGKDVSGLQMVKVANFLCPDFRDLVLLRAKVQRQIEITRPEVLVSDKEFVALAEEVLAQYPQRSERDKYVATIILSSVLLIEPTNELALMRLMAAGDKGMPTDLNTLLAVNFEPKSNTFFDPKDPRYEIAFSDKTINVPANEPWTNSFIILSTGQTVSIQATQNWGFGPQAPAPFCDADGFGLSKAKQALAKKSTQAGKTPAVPTPTPKRLKGMIEPTPGCLLAKFGNGNTVISIGKESAFTVETPGILYLGPYEWEDYADNHGNLKVRIKVDGIPSGMNRLPNQIQAPHSNLVPATTEAADAQPPIRGR